MIDVRYLGLSLIAVFLALAIGLTMGSALGNPEQESRAYELLRGQFDLLATANQEVRQENETLRRHLAAREQALAELLPLAVRDRLSGASVGILLCGDVQERAFWSELEGALQLAGARLGPIVRLPDAAPELEPRVRLRLATLWSDSGQAGGPEPFETAGWLLSGLTEPTPRHRLEDLAQAAGFQLRGSYDRPVRQLLLVTSTETPERLERVAAGEIPEVTLIQAAMQADVRLVGAEPEGAAGSVVEVFRRRGVPVVDNIDTPAGLMAAILALAGEDGHFGSKPGAARALPHLKEPGW